MDREDWQSGDINRLLDVIAPTKETTASVIANFKQVVKGGDLRLHPIVAKLVDAETLEKMGASKLVRDHTDARGNPEKQRTERNDG